MAADSDDEWLQELLAPQPSKRRRVSEDDVEALQFLEELLRVRRPLISCAPSLPAAQLVLRPALPAAFPVRLAARPAPSLAQRPTSSDRKAFPKGVFGAKSPNAPLAGAVSKVEFRLPQSSNAGAVLAHAVQLVRQTVERGPTIFKIGITADPVHRWGNPKYGYQHDRDSYQQMVVFSEADSAGAAMLEASLISMFKNTSGCRNTAPGGESARQGCAIYTYVVFRNLGLANAQVGAGA